ncbi:MAG: hypothetical protein MUC87_01300 [Bacteroidia bacterium]|jgi:hypothetical protein|nr:hypothetical protein [Bacteroidia bacterium]
MFTASENPTITIKRKNTQTVFDYCLDNDFTFSVRRAAGKDEVEIEFEVTDVKRGVLLGMFLRENRFELNGIAPAAPAAAPAAPRTAAKKATNGTAATHEQTTTQEHTSIAEEGLLLNLDAN